MSIILVAITAIGSWSWDSSKVNRDGEKGTQTGIKWCKCSISHFEKPHLCNPGHTLANQCFISGNVSCYLANFLLCRQTTLGGPEGRKPGMFVSWLAAVFLESPVPSEVWKLSEILKSLQNPVVCGKAARLQNAGQSSPSPQFLTYYSLLLLNNWLDIFSS